MNKEDKELLLKDLCARLPYGVKGLVIFNGNIFMTQAQVEERIIKLESMIRRAVIIDESTIDSNVVTIGSIVKVNDMDFEEEVEYRIVGAIESDPDRGNISNESPIGQALLGKKRNNVVEVQAPVGIIKLKILSIKK